jgi:RHS repeat-associated protein
LTVNNKTIRTEYSKEGIVTGITTPSGFKTLFLSDAMGQAIGYSDPLNNTTSFKRDTNGLISSVTDPLNRITSFLHNYHNQLTGVTLPGQTATQYNYNPVGNLTSLTDLLGSIWQFTYSPMGRQLSQKDPLNKTISYSYDTLGRLSTASYPDGVVKTMLYDANGNNTAINYSSGLSITSAYDPLNRLTSTNSINFGYNARGQITTSAQHSKNFAAAYTDGGRLANVAYNDSAFTVSYTYDSSGLLSKVSDNLGNFINIGYDNDNRLITTKRSNGVNLQNSYDNAGRITRMVDGAIIDIALTFDTAGQITQKSEIMPLNPADYLTGGELKLTFDAASQINSSGYVYDNRGRLTTAPGKSLSWDADGGLTGINSILYEYNGLKNLIKRTSGGVSTLYSYHHAIGNAPLVAEFNGGGQALKYYVYTPGGALLYMVNAANGDVSFYHFDQTGNTLALTNAQGALTDSYAYTPQGKLLAHSGSVSQPFTFSGATGVIQEPEHQDIYNHRVRWYDAGIGRFLSREQLWPLIEKPEMINPYQYALNNPVSFIDPGGTEPKLYSNSHFNQLGSRGNPLSPMYYDMPDAPIVTAKLAARAAASKKFTFVFKNRKEAALKVAKLVRKGILPPLNKGDKGIPIISTNKPIENFNYDKEHAEAENELDKLRKSIEDRSNSWTGFLTGNLYNDVGIDCIKLRQMASFDAIPKYFRNSSEWSVRVEADTAEFSGFDTSYDGIADVEIEIRFPETGFTDLRSEEMTAF